MAGMTNASKAVAITDEVIDLTLSDDESTPTRLTTPHFRPLSETPAGEPSGADLPDHGLLLDRDFGSFTRWGSGRGSGFFSRKLSKGGTFQLRRRITSKPSTRNNERGALPNVRQIQDYHLNPAKRRRVELDYQLRKSDKTEGDLLSSQTVIAEKKRGASPVSATSQSASMQALQGRGEDGEFNDSMNESLKIALRQQVFPHVNQRLSHYRLSIDVATRRQLGKKAAWEICGEEFMNNLMENDGRLSATFETKVAVLARSLIDQYAARFVTDSDKGQDNSEDFDPESLLKERPRIGLQYELETKKLLENGAEAARAGRKARLSAAMKGRWARGEMGVLKSKKAATLLVKKVGQKSSRRSHGFLKVRRSEALVLQRPARPLEPLKPLFHFNDDNNIFDEPRRQLIVNLRFREPLRLKSLLSRQDIARASGEGRSVPEFNRDGRPITRPARKFGTKEINTVATVTPPTPNSLNFRRDSGTRYHQRQIAFAESDEARQQIENLRLAGLDDKILRPYLCWQHRNDIERGINLIQTNLESRAELSETKFFALQGVVLHVDFCQAEIECMTEIVESVTRSTSFPDTVLSREGIENLMKGHEEVIPSIVAALSTTTPSPGHRLLRNRADSAITAFLQDAAMGLLSTQPEVQRIGPNTFQSVDSVIPPDSIKSLLRQRETLGRRRNPRICRSIKVGLLNGIEDDYVRKSEWTDCSGDIATTTWIDDNRFFSGATTHSDEHNMQYNKPGNLLVGNAVGKTLKSVPGHQIVRPIVTKGENSLEAMRGTQEPWMYCSVTSTAYCHDIRKCFTGSYDQTVKVWDIAEDGSSLNLCGTWSHSGNVNFVVASPNHGLVATAADVREDAVRVYHFDPKNITASAFSIYEASVQRHNSSDTWAYFPSTMQWGISPSVSYLLLVGYSPRSFNCHDEDIPEDRLNSGELCLWDSRDGSRIPITSARTQNVFEVAWHPTQPIFVAATSSAGTFEDWVKTQLRIFEQKACGSFCHVKTLDCPAADINEITIMPNSSVNSYVTASCTDGNTYVWDSALSDKPLHILRHGDSIDEYAHDETREETDIGVKFAAWGKNLDRFYTGSSDGVLKAWNIRAPPGHELVRDVMKLSGGISAGKFSPDFSKLVIGDSTGKVHLLSLHQLEPSEEIPTGLRRPITPHSPLPAPLVDDDDMEIPPELTAREISQEFVDRGQITIHEDEWVGAVQGPNYASTGLFYRVELGQQSEGWSIKDLYAKQQLRYSIDMIMFPQLPNIQSSSRLLHDKNVALDLDLATLLPATYVQLREARVDLNFQDENDFLFELGPTLGADEVEKGPLTQNQCLNDCEIQELHILKQQICYELKIQRGLKDLDL